ncbi:MAG: hypothetical protein QXE81_04660 [Desulfurococcaceae archaeon]
MPAYDVRKYKRPEKVVVIDSNINESLIKELGKLLRVYGYHGLKILISSSSKSSISLEYIREFLLSNTAFTIEVYIVDSNDLQRMLANREVNLVAKFTEESASSITLSS